MTDRFDTPKLLRHGNYVELIIIMFDLPGVKSGHVPEIYCEGG